MFLDPIHILGKKGGVSWYIILVQGVTFLLFTVLSYEVVAITAIHFCAVLQGFLWEAWQDLTLIILIIAAVVSLVLGIKTEVFLAFQINSSFCPISWLCIVNLDWLCFLQGKHFFLCEKLGLRIT